MKKYLTSFFLLGLFFTATITHAQEDQRVSHVVVVWLKEPGNAQMREQFIEASRAPRNCARSPFSSCKCGDSK